jgi:hypothetical protein
MSLAIENELGVDNVDNLRDKSADNSDNQRKMVKCKKIGNYVLGKQKN